MSLCHRGSTGDFLLLQILSGDVDIPDISRCRNGLYICLSHHAKMSV